MNQIYMKEKPVLQLVLSMSLPMILSMTVNSLYNIIDSLFVSKISEQAMTSLSLVYPLQNLINAVTIGFAIGINAVISIYLGAQDHKGANAAATQGMLLSILHGILLMIVSIAVMPFFLEAFTSDAEIISLGLQYSKIVFRFSSIIALGLFFEKLFQSVGKMTVSMICMMIGCIANIILDPVLIFGLGPAPEMGIEGAALATGIGQVLTLTAYLFFYFLRPIPAKIHIKAFCWDWKLMGKLYAIGIPATLNLALPSVLISALNAILSAYSQSYVLVLGIYYKLQTFLYLPASGIVQGMRPLVGYNYGAGERKRVRKIFGLSLGVNALIMLVGTVICFAAATPLMAMFTSNPETVRLGSSALKIISIGFIPSALSVTASGALEGLGKGTQSLAISMLRYIIVIIPAAYILCFFAGAGAVWNAFWIGEAATAVFVFFYSLPKVLGAE